MALSIFVVPFYGLTGVPATQAATNLLINGGFETPEVNTSQKWDIYPSGTDGLGWTVNWADDYSGAPATANLEIHENADATAPEGDQYAELDSDWDGPGGGINNEKANIAISQSVQTCQGGQYVLSYKWKPRSANGPHSIKVEWSGDNTSVSHSGTAQQYPGWQTETIIVTGSGGADTLTITETGTPDSFGIYVDDFSLEYVEGSCDFVYQCDAGMLYMDSDGSESDLYLVDTLTGNADLKKTYGGDFQNTLAADQSGNVYAIDRSTLKLMQLLPDGTTAEVAQTDLPASQGTLTIAPDDTMYIALNDERLYSVDMTTGASALLADLTLDGVDVEGGDIVVDEENVMTIINTSGQVWTVDLANGYAVTSYGDLGAGVFTGMAYIDGTYYPTERDQDELHSFMLGDPSTSVVGSLNIDTTSGDAASCAPARKTAGIAIEKSADSDEVFPGEVVTYTFTVTNTGELPLNNVEVSDDVCSPVAYSDGDTDNDNKLDTDETWTYACSQEITENTTNIGTADATDPFGDPVTDSSDSVIVVVKDPGCTLTQGYWKTHSSEGPAKKIDPTWVGYEDAVFALSDLTWYELLWTPVKGDAWMILAHQYIAAKLNVLGGASPVDISDSLTKAKEMLNGTEPDSVSKKDKKDWTSLAGTLGDYNEGLIGPGHCSEN